ncbi:hypothetical protein DI272_18315 [Streptomyces sp. Act143]|uniref:hypothetical protein n=1 Tax=Streptomyces sp. Act143 TaxID=2200760 RepID=UPI000D6830D1|nr:hypothetical protein [Streptomyces sp. Act143]PWI20536.1 hypothetical protein DI272_18315 [Streptomyces sp. Act143]
MPSAVRVLGLTLLTLLSAVPAAHAAADGWSAAPAGEARPSFYAEGGPGTVLQDAMTLTNRGKAPVDVSLRAEGAEVTFADARLRLPPRTRTEVPFTVTVPAHDGTAQLVARDTDGRTRRVPVHLRATVPTVAALTVEDLAVRADRITYTLVNRGTTTLAPRLAVHVDGLLGPLLDRAPRTLPAALEPGRRLTLSEPWDGPVLDSVEVRLTVTAAGGARDEARVSAGVGPWGAVAGGAGAAAAGGALLLVRRLRAVRRRRRPEGGRPESSSPEAELTGAVS